MPFYHITRHVLYIPSEKQTCEVYGIDRDPLNLKTISKRTDPEDPLRENDCRLLLVLNDGCHVTWKRMFEWLSEAETAGYELVSGFKTLSPYSQIILKGP